MKYRKVPELDWLKDLANDYDGMQTQQQITDLYRYLLWSRRYQLVEPDDPCRKMYFGLMLKYLRRIYPGTTPYEKQEIENAEKMFRSIKTGDAVILKRNPEKERSISSKKRSIK